MESDRSYGGIWEKSIGYPRKVYRLFSKHTVQTIRSLPSPNPLPLILRSEGTQWKDARSRCEEQCYARKGKKGEGITALPLSILLFGKPVLPSCFLYSASGGIHPFAHWKVPFTEQQMHPSAKTLFGFPLLCPMRWLLQSYYPFGETATGSG